MNTWRSVFSGFLALALIQGAMAQQWGGFQGGQARLGQHDANKRTFNPGRPFLRWWDPLYSLTTVIDNFEPGASYTPIAAWDQPTGDRAGFAHQEDLTSFPPPAEYRYATPVNAISVDEPWTPASGVAPAFQWQFTGLAAGEQYGVSVNIPIGPTDVDPTAATDYRFQARYFVYEITGVDNPTNPGQPIYQVVDNLQYAGGWVRLGNNGATTNQVYTVSAGNTITVRLLATVPRLADGSWADNASNVLVYADAARIEGVTSTAGTVTTQAVVGQNNAGPFPWRTVSVRSEDTTVQDGSVLKSFGFPLVTSYAFDGSLVNVTDTTGRRNMIWSWPVQRPFNATDTELQRYYSEKADWALGTGLFAADPNRTDHSILVDNTNANVRVGIAWTPDTVAPVFKGTDYLVKVAEVASTSQVQYEPKLTAGRYTIDVFIPQASGLATAATYEVRRGATLIATDTIDQNANAGRWVRIQVGQTSAWDSDDLSPLSLSVTGTSNPANGDVMADQVRFTKTADLTVRSTPIYTRAFVRVGATTAERDVVIVTMDNGRIYCLDARGLESAGTPTGRTQVYWVYPSEGSADPNWVAGEDGPDGMAEMPTAFNASSATMARVNTGTGTEDLLYIGSQNGRVYCINMEGRGDGTTTRRWSYPNDYPSASVESALGPIQGSVAFADTTAGPTVFVPTVQGRLYALDAVGDPINKTTNSRWTYPDIAGGPIGSITMAPVIGWRTGNPTDRVVYFGTNDASLFGGGNTMFAVNAVDAGADGIGDLLWSRDFAANPFGNFLNISPAFADQSDVNPNWPGAPLNPYGATMPNTLFIGNTNQEVAALDADNGNVIWVDDVGASPSAPLSFSHARLPDVASGATMATPEPMVVVPTTDGRYVSLGAPAGRLDFTGSRTIWTITGQRNGNVPAMSFGGTNAPFHNYMYGADAAGYLYAWSWDPTLPDDGQAITPGQPPIGPTDVTTDQTSINLGDIVRNARVDFILPQDFSNLQARASAGTLTQADLAAAINKVTRRHFEFGETAYLLVHNLPDPASFAPPFPYTVDLFFNAPGQSSQRVAFGLTPVGGAATPANNRCVLASFSFIGIGQNALVPGNSTITVRALSVNRQNANRTIPATSFRPSNTVSLANPLAVRLTGVTQTPQTQVGTALSPADADNIVNGTPASKLTTMVQRFRPELSGNADLLSHGTTGLTRLDVFDRSLMSLLFGGQRGLSGVRMELNNMNFLGNPIKPLDPLVYAGLEDLPGSPGTNVSLDYPDIRRDRMQVTKEQYGQVENPLFQGVSLIPPAYTQADLNTYRSDENQYNQFLNRTLESTAFDFEVSVPRFQPPTTDQYRGAQFVYVDAGAPGRQLNGTQAVEPYRQFGLSTAISIDERPVLGTPTVDLGSIPGGGGYLPSSPWNTAGYNMLDGRIHNSTRYPFFQRFSLFNEGNVNLLNVRMAKQIQTTGTDVVPLRAPSLNFRAQLDGRLHLHSDVDPFFAGITLSGRPSMGDRVILQKARPDDGEPTRLSVNPKRRANANLEVVDGYLLGIPDFANVNDYEESIKDPKVAVSVPIGTPVGRYQNGIYLFEDSLVAGPSPAYPTLNYVVVNGLDVYEPFTDSPMNLLFLVRESRLTTSTVGKAAPMADNIPVGPNFQYANQGPAVTRVGNGTMVVAITSDRLHNGAPSIVPGMRPETEAGNLPQWRIYFFTLTGGGTTPVANWSPMGDLDFWNPNTSTGNPATDKWFNPGAGSFPITPTEVIFNFPFAELVPNSAQFSNPSFPAFGFFEPTSGWGANGNAERRTMYMAFTGEVMRQVAGGERRRETRLLLSNLAVGSGGSVTASPPVPLNFSTEVPDIQAKLGKPSLVQSGNTATVFYPITASGSTQIFFSTYNGTQWVASGASRRGGTGPVNRLRTGDGFESVNNPSVVLRSNNSPAINSGTVIEAVFTGRLRGRSQPEVYMARIPSNGAAPRSADPSPFTRGGGALFDQLVYDPGAQIFWSAGADLMPDFNGANSIDLQQLVIAGNVQSYQSILVPGSRKQADGSSVVSYDTTLGGRAYIDLANGSVRLSGAIVPRTNRLFLRYMPRILRVSANSDVNHRSANITFDNRSSQDYNYWFNSGGTAITNGNVFPNRWVVTYGKTAARDSQNSRPYMMTMRVGVRLPRAVQLNANGSITNLSVVFTDGFTAPYQVDPAAGVIYFPPGAEGRRVNVTYNAIDRDGTPMGANTANGLPVDLVEEMSETVVPIEQVSNESAVTMALDMLGSNSFSPNGRPGLIWMFWSSTRSGGSDVFFQTIAPKFTPQANGQ
ncbi:MAG: PQQ-binding-like beta-propeller repeat protein [Chthonomonas sp.]|nr:PQQ-binding-like beta-propeller repeat protein [Chthonomonas sp.]